jgi:hypothetical protein
METSFLFVFERSLSRGTAPGRRLEALPPAGKHLCFCRKSPKTMKRPREALTYEPARNKLRLVGLEYIVDAATWLSAHSGAPPMLEGQAFQFVNSPNRYGIPAFFELHVWACPTIPTVRSWIGTSG